MPRCVIPHHAPASPPAHLISISANAAPRPSPSPSPPPRLFCFRSPPRPDILTPPASPPLTFCLPTPRPSHTRHSRSPLPHLTDALTCGPGQCAALGDAWLKLPAAHAALVFKHLEADWLAAQEGLDAHAARIRTPPYLSAQPDVYHRALPPSPAALVLASDGLTDLYDGYAHARMAAEWAHAVGHALDAGGGRGRNAALALLREAIGGADTQLVSRNLTVEMEERWMDDTTVLVLRLR